MSCRPGSRRREIPGTRCSARSAIRWSQNLYPQDAELNWGPRCYPAGAKAREQNGCRVPTYVRAGLPGRRILSTPCVSSLTGSVADLRSLPLER